MSKSNYYSGNGNHQELNGYTLSHRIFIFCENNPGLVKPKHLAVYFWIVELNKRLRWKDVIGLPTLDSMKIVGIKDRRTYKKALRDLEKWGFLEVVAESINQSLACQIRLLLKEDCEIPIENMEAINHPDRRLNHNNTLYEEGLPDQLNNW